MPAADHDGPRRPPAPGDGGLAPGRAALALVFALLALAGWVDGVGLAHWGGLYVSFMSGNTAELGGSFALGDWPGAGQAGRALLMFVVGVVLGEVAAPSAGRWRGPAVVTAEAALLWVAAGSAIAGWGDAATASAAGLAMGVQTAAVHRADGVGVALTYVTGTLVNLGRAVGSALRGEASWGKALPFAGFWISLCLGSLGGAAAARAGLGAALAAAAGIASALAIGAGAVAAAQPAARPTAAGSPQATKAPLR